MSYVFDFDREIARLREAFPEAEKMTFIDAARPDAEEAALKWRYGPAGRPPEPDPAATGIAKTLQDLHAAHARIFEMRLKQALKSPCTFQSAGRGRLIIVNSGIAPHVLGLGDTGKTAWFSLYHETAHALQPAPDAPADSTVNEQLPRNIKAIQSGETVADGFAALEGLRLGILTPDDIEKISQKRAFGALVLADLHHLTSMTLDLIAQDWRDGKAATSSPAESAALAKAYGARGALTSSDIKAQKKAFARFVSKNMATAFTLVVNFDEDPRKNAPVRAALHAHFTKVAAKKPLLDRLFPPAEPRLETRLAAKIAKAMEAAP